jgi:sulfonate transport system permease protein
MNGRAPLAGLGGVALFLAVWELAVRSHLMRYDYLPAPSAILAALAAMSRDATVWAEIGHTVLAALLGWSMALALGLTAGVALGLSPFLRRYTLASVEVLRPLPAVAFVPVGLLLFGFSISTELLVIVIPSVWPILVNTMGGIAAVPQRLHDVTRVLRLSRLHAIGSVFIPAAAPAILVGCRLSLGIALVLAIISEMLGNPEGLGYAVVREAQALHPDQMFAYVFITGILGILFNAAVMAAGRLALPGEFLRPVGIGGGVR